MEERTIRQVRGAAELVTDAQAAITAIAYGAVRAGNAIAGAVVTTAIDRLAPGSARAGDARESTPGRR